MSVKDGYVDSPWWALADVTNSPLGVTSLPADDVAASESDGASEVLDLSQRQSVSAASTSLDDLAASAGRRSDSSWCDINDDDDDDDDDDDTEQHMMTSLSRRAPFMKRSCIGERFVTALSSLRLFFENSAVVAADRVQGRSQRKGQGAPIVD